MRTKQTMRMVVVLLGLVVGRDAAAFYNPQTGRWLNRDPIVENGGVALYAFVRGNSISLHDALGREFTDLGEETVFSCGTQKATTDTGMRDFRARCVCFKGLMCKIKLLAFRMTTKSKIGLYRAPDINAPGPYPRYSDNEVARNRAHEAKHRERDRQWHDQNIAGIISDFSQVISCAACPGRITTLMSEWRTRWAQFFAAEAAHTDPTVWTDADRTPSPPEIDPDPTRWWDEPIPVDRLNDQFSDPLGVWDF